MSITPEEIEITARKLATLQAQPDRNPNLEESVAMLPRSPFRVSLTVMDMVSEIPHYWEGLNHSGKRSRDVNFVRFHKGDESLVTPDPNKWYLEVVEPLMGWGWHAGVEAVLKVAASVREV